MSMHPIGIVNLKAPLEIKIIVFPSNVSCHINFSVNSITYWIICSKAGIATFCGSWYGFSKQFYLRLALIWPRMTLDPSIALHFGQGFVLPNLVAAPAWPLNPSLGLRTLHFGQGFLPPNLVATGHPWTIWYMVDPGWPLHDLRP